MSLTLPAPRTEALITGFPKTGLVLVTGYPKSGKSMLVASAPDSVVVELEDGGADRIPYGRILEIRSTDPHPLDRWNEAMDAIMSDDSIKVVGVDTADKLALMFQEDISNLHMTKNMSPRVGLDSRVLWGEFAERVRTVTNAFKNCGKLVVLIAHTRPPKQDEQGRIVTPAGINVAGQGGDYIVAQAEMIGHVGVRVVAGKAEHFITFRSPSDLAIWRTRVTELADREVVLDKENPWKSLTDAARPARAAIAAVKSTGGRKK